MIFIRIIIFFLLGYFVSFLYKKLRKDNKKSISSNMKNKSNMPEEMKQDPVCKTYVPKSQAVIYSDIKETVYFCSKNCRDKYKNM